MIGYGGGGITDLQRRLRGVPIWPAAPIRESFILVDILIYFILFFSWSDCLFMMDRGSLFRLK